MRFTAILALVLVASAIRVNQDDTAVAKPAEGDMTNKTMKKGGKKNKKCKGKKNATAAVEEEETAWAMHVTVHVVSSVTSVADQ